MHPAADDRLHSVSLLSALAVPTLGDWQLGLELCALQGRRPGEASRPHAHTLAAEDPLSGAELKRQAHSLGTGCGRLSRRCAAGARKIAIFVEPSPFSHVSGMKIRFSNLIKGLR